MDTDNRSSIDKFSVAARLDRLPIVRTHRIVTLVVGLGLFFDAYENFLAATIQKVLQNDFTMDATTLKLVLASAFLGQFLGAVVMGRLADKVGRRRAFLINLAIYSLFSLIGAFSPNAAWLVASRFLAGIGIGGEYALADSYLSDFLPPTRRGRYISWAYTISFLGVPAVGFMARWLVPLHPLGIAGWRWLFVFGALGSFAVWVVRRGLPESPRWLEIAGRRTEADAIVSRMEAEARMLGPLPDPVEPDLSGAPHSVALSNLFRAPYARRTTMLWILSALEVFGYYGFGTIAPAVLAAKGYSIVASIGFTAVTFLGYPVGSLIAVAIVERMERKYLVMGSALLMAVFGLGFGFAGSTAAIVIFGALYTMSSNVFSNAYHVYLAESYPTAIRGSAAGAAYSLSKIVTGALPFILIPVLDHHGSGWVFALVAVAMGLLIINVGALGGRSTGRSVDSI